MSEFLPSSVRIRPGRSRRLLTQLAAVLTGMVLLYSALFVYVMEQEGQENHGFFEGIYWTLVTMSTLGYGDITFNGTTGRVLTIVVLLSGVATLLLLLPFLSIQLLFIPWLERRAASRAPRKLGDNFSGHLVITGFGPVEEALIRRASRSGIRSVLVVDSVERALELDDAGHEVMVGRIDDPVTYRNAHVERAALVAATRTDTTNTNTVFTVREITSEVTLIATASSPASVDVLQLAGATTVIELGTLLGRMVAHRVLAPDSRCHVLGTFGNLQVAEFSVKGTPLAGTTIGQASIRTRVGITVVGYLDRGRFDIATAETFLPETARIIVVGTTRQLDAFDRTFSTPTSRAQRVIVIGGGKVGRAVAQDLLAAGVDYRVIERRTDLVVNDESYVAGDAAELHILEQAGIHLADSVVVTTHDDDINVFLTLYCRRLRPDIEIVSRANLDRNVSTLYRAGADTVLSYASVAATTIWNETGGEPTVLVADGVDVVATPLPKSLEGRTLTELRLRTSTGITVIGIIRGENAIADPDAEEPLRQGDQLLLLGDNAAHLRFRTSYIH
jgi:voltage-gated potassium channel